MRTTVLLFVVGVCGAMVGERAARPQREVPAG